MAIYNVLLARAQTSQADVQVGGITVKAEIPAFVVQLVPVDLPTENSVIKLVYPGETEHAPFVEGAQVDVTFDAA